MKHSDVVIVGAGVIGSSIAYHLGKRGMSCTLVEREAIGARASGKAWAVITYPPGMLAREATHHTDVPGTEVGATEIPAGEGAGGWLRLLASSYERMPDLALEIAERGGVDAEYGESLSTVLFTDAELEKEGRDDLLAQAHRFGGVETGWLDHAQLREVFPSLDSKWVAGMTSPQGQVEPYKFTLGLAQAAESLGTGVKQGEAVGFDTRGDRITGMKLASGELLEADQFVIAAGPWSRPVASHLGVDVPMSTFMAECVRLEMPGGLPLHTLVAGDFWIIPKVNGEVIVGPYEGCVSPRDDYDDSLTEELMRRTLSKCVEILPALEEAKLVEHRGDLLAGTSLLSEKPTLGRLPQWENGYLATHFSGLGIMLSPAVGELMAELIATGRLPLRAAQMLAELAPRS